MLRSTLHLFGSLNAFTDFCPIRAAFWISNLPRFLRNNQCACTSPPLGTLRRPTYHEHHAGYAGLAGASAAIRRGSPPMLPAAEGQWHCPLWLLPREAGC